MKTIVKSYVIRSELIPVRDYLESKRIAAEEKHKVEYNMWKQDCLEEHNRRVHLSEKYDQELRSWRDSFLKGVKPLVPIDYLMDYRRDTRWAYDWVSSPTNTLPAKLQFVEKLLFIYSVAEEYEMSEVELEEIYELKSLVGVYDN